MTNERTAMLMGDPPYRAAAYADDAKRIERELREQQERVAADRDWRKEYAPTIRRELVTAKPAPPTVEQQVIALWNAETPIGAIADMSGLPLGRVYEIVSSE